MKELPTTVDTDPIIYASLDQGVFLLSKPYQEHQLPGEPQTHLIVQGDEQRSSDENQAWY